MLTWKQAISGEIWRIKWQLYGYCRLSRDEDKENYASIEEQKRIIQDYAISRNWTISDFYIDDNVSGYTFNRPEFKKMLENWNSNFNILLFFLCKVCEKTIK